jgi:hypothetical protein
MTIVSLVLSAEDVVHEGRSATDRMHDHVAVNGLGGVAGLWLTVSLMSWIGTPLPISQDRRSESPTFRVISR